MEQKTNSFKDVNVLLLFLFVMSLLLLIVPDVFASQTTGMPWETPLTKIQNSISGPVALSISIIAIVISGAILIFGGEIGEFARRMIMIVLVIALIVASNSVLAQLFTTSALII